jgi:hypothetical protein
VILSLVTIDHGLNNVARRALPETTEFVHVLEAFRTKPTNLAGEVEEMWREGPHDDLVLAVAVAAWMGERCPPEVGAVPVVMGSVSYLWPTVG